MGFVSLYRKWRSKNFDEVVGQLHVTQTVKNAIAQGRIAHAYLFCGPRGTGKTSTARILAKALNCEKGPSSQPCNTCEFCNQINSGLALDVIEIDAASNRGINEIRELREKVKYAPTKGKYKVYIVDEVHMLTKEAFNALLKTLEEPPGHVVFVLATTEPHKLLPTILSRCQRFDFRRISIIDTVNHLKNIARKEELAIQDEALTLIAKNSEGSLRDALSLLDQLISFCGKSIKFDDVVTVLGSVSEQIFIKLIGCIINQDPAQALNITRKLIEEGKDINQLIKDFIQSFRDILVIKICPDNGGLIDKPQSTIRELEQLSQKIGMGKIMHCIKILTDLKYQMTWDTQWHIQTEISLLKMCQRSIDTSQEAIDERLKELEEKIKNLPQIMREAKSLRVKEDIQQVPLQPGDLIGYTAEKTEKAEKPDIIQNKPQEKIKEPEKKPYEPYYEQKTAAITPPDEEWPAEFNEDYVPPVIPAEKIKDNRVKENTPSYDEEVFSSALNDREENVHPSAKRDLTIDFFKSSWEEFLYNFKRENLPIYQLLINGELSEIQGNLLIIAFTKSFYKDQIEDRLYKDKIEEALEKLAGTKIVIKGKIIEKKPQEISLFGDNARPERGEFVRNREKEKTTIDDVTKLFGGEILN